MGNSFLYLQVDNQAVVAGVGGVGGEYQAVQGGFCCAARGDGDGVFAAAFHDLGGVVKGIPAQGGIGNVADGASLGQGDAQHLRRGRRAAFPYQAAGRELHGLRHAELHAQRHFFPIACFGGNGFLDIPVKGAGVYDCGELAAADMHLGAVAVRFCFLNLFPAGFKDDGGAFLPELQRHYLRRVLERGQHWKRAQQGKEESPHGESVFLFLRLHEEAGNDE